MNQFDVKRVDIKMAWCQIAQETVVYLKKIY